MTTHRPMRVGIIVVAYNAASTLIKTLNRIPRDFYERIAEIIICDDASNDSTFDLGREWALQSDNPKTYVIHHTKNLGYGGNQKAAYSVALRHGLDAVILLHGDGQYAPESLPSILAPLERGQCDAVFGSRMLLKGAARRGGMPLYKLWGNRVLTKFANVVLKTDLSEFHSGYRAYTSDILRRVPFQANSDGFDFDTQIILQVLHAGGRILEVPIPTYYGDEICYVNGIKYARDVVADILEYRLAVAGFGTSEWVTTPDDYAFKEGDGSSHAMILQMVDQMPASKILDLGCSGGLLAEKLRARGHYVVGVDRLAVSGVRERTDAFYAADLEHGIPPEAGSSFDLVIAGDVIEHLTRPLVALRQIAHVLRPGGQVILSVPNFAHWYPRLRVALGLFGYDRRGILDATHLRFFTRANLRRMIRSAGFDIVEESATGLPLGIIDSARGPGGLIQKANRALVRARPTLFGYQFLLRTTPHAGEMVWSDHLIDPRDSSSDDDALRSSPLAARTTL
jgi:glycosyltransferase involved in cell wall biosynthesis/2-polyprenyl-3-methyl-5-hydroxy-6-metoxy-1,4-benzoquinol methylase